MIIFGFGVLLTFAPGEVVHAAGGSKLPLLLVSAQAGGALYLGFAILNWMAKDDLLGGISSLPRAMGTFAVVLTYSLLALGFGFILFRHPEKD